MSGIEWFRLSDVRLSLKNSAIAGFAARFCARTFVAGAAVCCLGEAKDCSRLDNDCMPCALGRLDACFIR